jgi:hypothetical protein
MATFKLTGSQKKLRAQLIAKLETATALYREAAEDFGNGIQTLGADLRATFDSRSESWQESDAGSAAAALVESYETFDHEGATEITDPHDVIEYNGLSEESEEA